MLKGYIVNLTSKIEEKFIEMYKNISQENLINFIEDVIAILDYYTEPIFKCGKLTIQNKLGNKLYKNNFSQSDIDFINNYKNIYLNQYCNSLKKVLINNIDNLGMFFNELLDMLLEEIVKNCIILYRNSQICELKNENIKNIIIYTDENHSCEMCKLKSKFITSIDNFNIEDFHPFCKITIQPLINNILDFKINECCFKNCPIYLQDKIKKLFTTINIYLKNSITPKNFIFKNLSNDEIYIENSDDIFISNFYKNLEIEKIILKYLLKDKLLLNDLTWWKNKYEEKIKSSQNGYKIIIFKSPFINKLSEISYDNYFIESCIEYIINPSQLIIIDNECYEQLKKYIFNNIEFIRR